MLVGKFVVSKEGFTLQVLGLIELHAALQYWKWVKPHFRYWKSEESLFPHILSCSNQVPCSSIKIPYLLPVWTRGQQIFISTGTVNEACSIRFLSHKGLLGFFCCDCSMHTLPSCGQVLPRPEGYPLEPRPLRAVVQGFPWLHGLSVQHISSCMNFCALVPQ